MKIKNIIGRETIFWTLTADYILGEKMLFAAVYMKKWE